MRQRAARLLSRRWVVVVLAVSVCIGGALLLLIHVLRTPPIMGQLPADLRASCSAKGTSATCLLPDKTVVFYRLFDTAAAARADVVNGNELAPKDPVRHQPSSSTRSSAVMRSAQRRAWLRSVKR